MIIFWDGGRSLCKKGVLITAFQWEGFDREWGDANVSLAFGQDVVAMTCLGAPPSLLTGHEFKGSFCLLPFCQWMCWIVTWTLSMVISAGISTNTIHFTLLYWPAYIISINLFFVCKTLLAWFGCGVAIEYIKRYKKRNPFLKLHYEPKPRRGIPDGIGLCCCGNPFVSKWPAQYHPAYWEL